MSSAGPARSRSDLLAYLPLAVTTTAADVLGRDRAHAASKMLLAPTLAVGVLASRSQRSVGRTGTLVTALVGSTVGDWFMYRSSRAVGGQSRQLMRVGASAFAVQQAGLIGLLLRDGARATPIPSAGAAGVMAVLAVLDSEAGVPDPVIGGYGALLGSMAALAMGEGGGSGRRDRRGIALGGGLFLLSDAAIILGQRFASTPRRQAISSGVILSTYAAALGLLVHGLRDAPPTS